MNFIVFEGIDGCGKSTQIAILKRAIEATTMDSVKVVRETSGAGNQTLCKVLNDGSGNGLSSILDFYSNRFRVLKNLQWGNHDWVLWDRYTLSTEVYNATNAQELQICRYLEKLCRTPDLTILLTCAPETARDRSKKTDSYDCSPLEEYRRRNEAYRAKVKDEATKGVFALVPTSDSVDTAALEEHRKRNNTDYTVEVVAQHVRKAVMSMYPTLQATEYDISNAVLEHMLGPIRGGKRRT